MKRYNPKVDDCVAAIVIVFAVPTLVMIGSVVMLIVKVSTGGVAQ